MALFENTGKWFTDPASFMLQSEQASESIGRNFGQAFSAAMQNAERKREFDLEMPLKVSQAETENKWRTAETASKLIQNNQAKKALEDGVVLKSDMAALDALHEPDAMREFTSQHNYNTTQGRQAFENYRTQRISQLSATDAERSKELNLATLNKRYSTIPVEGQLAVDDLRGEDGKWNWPATVELGQWEVKEQARKLEEAKQLKAIGPTIAADSRETVASIAAQGKIDSAQIKTEGDLEKQQRALVHKAVDTLPKANFDSFHEKSVAIRTDKTLDLKQKILRLDALNSEFKLNASPSADSTAPAKAQTVNSFSSEDEARAYGKSGGDLIFLQGVGKVRLK